MNLYTRIMIKFLARIGILVIVVWCITGVAIWMYYYSKNKLPANEGQPSYLYVLLLLTGVLLAAMIAAFLFGRRIGAPVLHIMDWLRNLTNQSYSEPTDAKGIPKSKKGAGAGLRKPYNMYRDVLATMENLAAVLQQNELERERLERTRDEWLTGITHDLRTPLASVKGYADLFAAPDYRWTDQEIRQLGRVISEKAAYMDELIEDLGLTFRLRNNALPMRRRPADVAEIVRRAVIDWVNHPLSGGQEVRFDSAADGLIYPLDAQWFTRAIHNLVANASLHNPAGVTISVGVRPLGKAGFRQPGFQVEIRDNGAGMDEETAAHLFDRYYRGTNTSERQVKGSGLGAAIARQLVEAHGGHISVESTPGQGAVILIELPPYN